MTGDVKRNPNGILQLLNGMEMYSKKGFEKCKGTIEENGLFFYDMKKYEKADKSTNFYRQPLSDWGTEQSLQVCKRWQCKQQPLREAAMPQPLFSRS